MEIDGGSLTFTAIEPDGTVIESTQHLAPVGVHVADPEGSRVLRLSPPFPNPFVQRTTIGWQITRSTRVRLTIFDVQGRRIRKLVSGPLGAGAREIIWDGLPDAGAGVPAGVYFYRLEAEGRTQTGKLVRVK